jgi:serine/threonine-protein kinase
MTGRDPGTGGGRGLPPGTRLNGIFEIESLIAVGGMGEIYKGFSIQTHDTVAIKTLRPDFAGNEAALALFRKEASALHNLQHEAIVRYFVFSVDPDLGAPYLAMEFVEGRALSERLQRGPLAIGEAVVLLRRLATGLQAAHDLGIVHRDVSPDNVILPGDSVGRAKIIDFGIARSPMGGGTVIGSGFAGKLNYVAPEQIGLFGGDVTGRSDIYSLGLVMAETLLGAPLDMGGSHVELIEKRRSLPDLSAIDTRIRPLLARMLQPRPEDRPASMAEVAAWQPPPGVIAAPAGTAVSPAAPRRGSRRMLAVTAAAVVVLAIVGAGAFLFGPALIGSGGPKSAPGSAAATPPLLTPAPAPAPATVKPAAKPPSPPEKTADAGTAPTLAPAPAVAPAATPAPAPKPAAAQAPLVAAPAPALAPAPIPASAAAPPGSSPGTSAASPPPPATHPQRDAETIVAALTPPPAQPAPVAAPPAVAPSPATASSPVDQVTRFIEGYRGGDCFLVTPTKIGVRTASIEAFGALPEPFEQFDAAFKKANGFEATIDLRQIAAAQCPIVGFLSRLGASKARGIALSIGAYTVHSGDFLTGSVSGPHDNLALLLVSDDGYVHDLGPFTRVEGDRLTFKVKIEETTAPGVKPQLVLALVPSQPLAALTGLAATPADKFVAALQGDIARSGATLGFAAQFFKLSE